MYKKIVALLVIIAVIVIAFFYGFFEITKEYENKKPVIEITYPYSGSTVSKIVLISGTAFDPDGADTQLKIEIMIDDQWINCDGNEKWSYEWITFGIENGIYKIYVRAWDEIDYSVTEEIEIEVYNPEVVESDAHKWAIFIAASNFPESNESKLGNGALNLAEDMAEFFIKNLGYSTSSIFILFDDGWIREDNGFGKPIMTLQQRKHQYDITYAGATKEIVTSSINYIIEESNKFSDSEVFIWIASHGCGDQDNKLFGGKLFERSAIFLWDDILIDNELGNLLSTLRSDKTCIIVDACFSGGFADKTIFNFPENLFFRSKLPQSGRVIITGASKFRVGYASTTEGPLFSQIWFYGLISGEADGFRPFIFKIGRPTRLKIFKDGKVSVEESFYYARYIIRKDNDLEDYNKMEPQINDQYPHKGLIRSKKGLILGE